MKMWNVARTHLASAGCRLQCLFDYASSDNFVKTDFHHLHERQNLLMHREAVRMLQAVPLLAEKALVILARWDGLVSRWGAPRTNRGY